MLAKAKARRKGREVTLSAVVFWKITTCFETLTCILKSFSMFFETLICILKCSSVFCNTTTTDAGKKDNGEEEGEEGGN